jgi:pyruvate dehydrogenase E1 component alpha subunit
VKEPEPLQLLAPDGTVTAAASHADHADYTMDDDQLRAAYRHMVDARAADEWAFSLHRQGRLHTYAPSTGQEANSVGALMALRDDDWFVQSYRELGGLIVRGVPLSQYFLYWLGYEAGNAIDPEQYHVTPISIPIASQLPHAVGLAQAERYLGTDRIAIGFIGEGGTSEGDFHEALNFAGVWNAPTIFFVQNNQYAISLPRSKQTKSASIAAKADAYGLRGVQVDGNDVTAVFAATAEAAALARAGGTPTLIEGITYRVGPHTTSDDPTRYRAIDEVAEWKNRDPIVRLQKLLVANGLMDEAELADIIETARQHARDEFDSVEASAAPVLKDVFDHVYAEMPPILVAQMEERRRLLERTGK